MGYFVSLKFLVWRISRVTLFAYLRHACAAHPGFAPAAQYPPPGGAAGSAAPYKKALYPKLRALPNRSAISLPMGRLPFSGPPGSLIISQYRVQENRIHLIRRKSIPTQNKLTYLINYIYINWHASCANPETALKIPRVKACADSSPASGTIMISMGYAGPGASDLDP
jgi:hypothetical protein